MDDTGHVTECRRCLRERMTLLPAGYIDGCGARVESRIAEDVRRTLGTALAEIGQQDVLPRTDPSGNRLSDGSGADHNDDFAHSALLRRWLGTRA